MSATTAASKAMQPSEACHREEEAPCHTRPSADSTAVAATSSSSCTAVPTTQDRAASRLESNKGTTIAPETTRPPPTRRAWGQPAPSSPTRSNNAPATKQKNNNLLAIMQEEEDAKRARQEKQQAAKQQQQREATQIAAMEQEEEMIRLALERSLTDLHQHAGISAAPPTNNNHHLASPQHSTRSINSNKSGSSGSASADPLAWKVQLEAETTELHISSPHGAKSPMLNRRILIKPTASTNSMRSLGGASSASSSRSLNQSSRSLTAGTKPSAGEQVNLEAAKQHLSPAEIEQIERALGSGNGDAPSVAAAATTTPSKSCSGEAAALSSTNPAASQYSTDASTSVAAAAAAASPSNLLIHHDALATKYDLSQVSSDHLSAEELEQIAQALRESTELKSGNSANDDEVDQKPAAAAAAAAAATSKPPPTTSTATLSQEESDAIQKALKEADEQEERNSLLLAMQMLQEDQERLGAVAQNNSNSNQHRWPQGNVRTMTRAELQAEQNYDYSSVPAGVGAGDVPQRRYRDDDDYDEEHDLAAGFRMNTSSRQEWNRLDQHSVVGPNNEIRTKHDASLQGQANAQRLGLERGEGALVGNKAYNSFIKSVRSRQGKKGVAAHGTGRAGSDADATKGGAMDPTVRIEISRAINNGLIEKCNGVVKEGKEAIIYHADKGIESEDFDVAVKVFKRIQEFKGRGDYVVGDPRYAKVSFKNAGQREQLALWAEKEFRNLVRANRVGVPVPTPLLFKENILFMRFLGVDGWPNPQLRELELRRGSKRWATLYNQTMSAIRTLYQQARLVHADLSEYNIMVVPSFLVQNKAVGVEDDEDLQIALIDFGQAVDVRHPEATGLLGRDIDRVQSFFKRAGVGVMGEKEALEFVTKPDELPPSNEESSED